MTFRVGFDVGGTFTDFALQAEDGRLLTGKRLTTPDDPARACLEGLQELVTRAGLHFPALRQAVHGTTLGSNIVIERKGRDVALLTTRGFRDVLVIGREKRGYSTTWTTSSSTSAGCDPCWRSSIRTSPT